MRGVINFFLPLALLMQSRVDLAQRRIRMVLHSLLKGKFLEFTGY